MIDLQPENQFIEVGDVVLESGQTLLNARLCYQQIGRPNAAHDNIVLIGGYYGGSHWGNLPLLGAGSPLASGDWCVLLVNLLGVGRSSSPSTSPQQPGPAFPAVTIGDNIAAQRRLLDRLFGHWQLALVAGWSMAGLQAWHWAVAYPDRVRAILPFCATARCWPHNRVFLEGVKAALQADGSYAAGHYRQPPERGLRAFGRVYAGWAYSQPFFRDGLYRQLGFATIEALLQFWEEDHLAQDANDLLAVLHSWQQADVATLAGGDLAAALARVQARVISMPCTTDLYFTAADAALEVALVAGAELRPIVSDWGHCAGGPGRNPQVMAEIFAAMAELLAG